MTMSRSRGIIPLALDEALRPSCFSISLRLFLNRLSGILGRQLMTTLRYGLPMPLSSGVSYGGVLSIISQSCANAEIAFFILLERCGVLLPRHMTVGVKCGVSDIFHRE